MNNLTLIPCAEIKSTLKRILLAHAFPESAAETCAEVFATNSLEGVHSHGVNRFPKFMEYVTAGYVRGNARAVCRHAAGAVEQWDGQSGPGPVNAIIAADRAMELARQHGMGCVALANTNHWLRGGTYGWRAARAGFAYIAWSNTIANMPPWGAVDAKLGNNPLVIAVPANPVPRPKAQAPAGSPAGGASHSDEAVVIDMALSQYSFGALEIKKQQGAQLPLPGGYDQDGNLTTDPGAIIASRRPLPIGYWKGAGLSLLLDIVATILSGGSATADITARGDEQSLSQVFLCVDLSRLHNYTAIGASIRRILDDYTAAIPATEHAAIRYPGQNIAAIRKEGLEKGIPVVAETWEQVKRMAGAD